MATASAVVPSYSMPGMLMKENFADLLNTQFKFVKERSWGMPVQGLRFYNIESTSKDYEKHSYMTGIGLVPKNRDADALPFASPIQGFDNTYTPVDYRLEIRIEKRLRETDQYGVINRQIQSLTDAAKDTSEYWAALPFNTGFDSTCTWLCADGMYLFDDSRPSEAKDVATWGNLESAAAMTPSGVATMRLNFRKTVNERGLKRPIVMKMLIVPSDLQDTAETIDKTVLAVGKSINDVNVDQNRYEVVVWDYLTSTTAWFGMGDKGPLHELYWYWRVKPESVSGTMEGSGNPDVWWARVRFSFVTGADRPINIRGSVGA